ncbi:MAG TPA: DUF4349 domain-containing protein [Gaiellaceae bacterium]|nr:DUF4349 domain-containing protein [Gaiellaceae bacterium]
MRRHRIALMLAALLLALTACSRDDDGNGASAESAQADEGAAVAEESAQSGGGEGDLASQPAGGGRGGSLPSFGPRVIQTASLTLSLPRNEFQETSDRARLVATSLGGFVVGSSATQGREGRLVRGSLTLRVPERSYGQAMRELAALGRVETREESGQDVSQEFVDLEARRRHLEAVERQLLSFLDRAETVAAALAVQSQLNTIQLELEQVRGRLRYLDDQVAYATISVVLRERQAALAEGDEPAWGIVDAWRTAARGFVTVVGWILVAAATAAPILLLLALAFLAGRFAIRRTMPVWRRS